MNLSIRLPRSQVLRHVPTFRYSDIIETRVQRTPVRCDQVYISDGTLLESECATQSGGMRY